MAKFMFKVSYTLEGVNGLLAVGGSQRAGVLERMIKSAGGSMESFYYAFGDEDLYIVAELPDDAAAVAISLRVSAGGAGGVKTTVLMDPATIDEAVKRDVSYTTPTG